MKSGDTYALAAPRGDRPEVRNVFNAAHRAGAHGRPWRHFPTADVADVREGWDTVFGAGPQTGHSPRCPEADLANVASGWKTDMVRCTMHT